MKVKMNKNTVLRLNVFTALLSQVLMLVANFLTKQALMKQLGAEYLGLQTVFGNFGDIFTMTFTATGLVMLFSLYAPLEQGDHEKTASMYCLYQKIYRVLVFSIAVVGVLLLAAVVLCINGSLSLWDIVINYLLYLAGILIYNRYLNNYYFLMAEQKRYVDCLVCGIGDIVFLIPQIGLLVVTGNYSVFLLMIVLKNAVECLLISAVVRKQYPYLRKEKVLPDLGERKKIRKNIFDMVISKIGSLLLYNTDSIIISSLISTAVSGCYSGYYFISYGLFYLLVTVFDTLMPWIGRLSVRNSRDQQFNSYRMSCMFNMAAVVLCICGFYYAAKDLLILWMGEEVLLTDSIFPIMCICLYISMSRVSSSAYREADGLFASISWVILLRGVLNVVLSVIFGLWFGLLGIIAATAVSDGFTVFWYEPRMLLHSFGKSMLQEVQYQVVMLFALFGGLFLCGMAVSPICEVSWGCFFLKVLIIIAVCAVWLAVLIGVHLLIRRHVAKAREDA